MPRRVFLDSGIFIAFMDRSDAYHASATELMSLPPARWATSLAVVSETYGWFLYRQGEQSARRFRELLSDLPALELLPMDARHHAAVERKLDRHRGRKLTYVDASSLVWLERRRIAEVWGTDADLALEGARVRPRLS
jgi:predicted nucleic acid-binding protein